MYYIFSGDDEGASLRQRLGINVTDLPPDPILEHVLRLSQSDYTGIEAPLVLFLIYNPKLSNPQNFLYELNMVVFSVEAIIFKICF